MAGKAALTLALAWACAFVQAELVAVPLKHHPAPRHAHSGQHTHFGLNRLAKRSGYDVEEDVTFADNDFWYGEYTVGATKNLRLAIDTGSPWVVVNPGLYTPSSAAVNLHSIGNASYIGTKPDGCGSLVIRYNRYKDTVSLEGLEATDQHLADLVKFKDSTPGAETKLQAPFQGILGFGGKVKAPPVGGKPWFATLCEQGKVDECRFGVAFGTEGKGKQVFGGIDTSLFSGSLSRTPGLSKGSWEVNGGFANNGKVLETKQTFILDTGTPNVIGPMAHVKRLFDLNNIQTVVRDEPGCFSPKVLFGYYPCDAPPKIGFTIGTEVFNIEGTSFKLKDNGNNNCTSTLVGVEGKAFAGSDGWLIGQAWMQGKYFDFDLGGNSVAAAELRDKSVA